MAILNPTNQFEIPAIQSVTALNIYFKLLDSVLGWPEKLELDFHRVGNLDPVFLFVIDNAVKRRRQRTLFNFVGANDLVRAQLLNLTNSDAVTMEGEATKP